MRFCGKTKWASIGGGESWLCHYNIKHENGGGAAPAAFRWLEKFHYRDVVYVTESLSMLQTIETGMCRMEWLESIRKSQVSKVTWIFCPGHAGVLGNEQADKLTGLALVNTLVTGYLKP